MSQNTFRAVQLLEPKVIDAVSCLGDPELAAEQAE
jgi:hypothetical protein